MDYLGQEMNHKEDAYHGELDVHELGGGHQQGYLYAYENQTYSAVSVPAYENQAYSAVSVPAYENQTYSAVSVPAYENQAYSAVSVPAYENQTYSAVSGAEIGMQPPAPFMNSTEALTPPDKKKRKCSRRLIIITSVVGIVLLSGIIAVVVYFFTKAAPNEDPRAESITKFPNDMFLCRDHHKYIQHFKLCDLAKDCLDGSDEDLRICNIACSFETNEVCGYKNASSTDRWMQMNSATSDFLDSSKFGFFMIAYPSKDFPMKMQSPKVTMQENKCLRFDYYSTGKLTITLDSFATIKWLDNDRHKYWREGQFDVPPGDAIVYIVAEWNGLDSLVAIDNIKVLDGSCRDKLLECPDEMASCSDNYTCIVKYKLCDSETDCFDGSDEDRHYCNIACSFETNEVCGYKNASSTDRWMQMNSATSDFLDSRKFGFFMIAYPSEDFPMKMRSPKVTMQENKCLRFDYYSTGKLTVTLDSSSTIKWLDNGRHKYWREGQFDVPPGDAIVYIMAEWNGLDSLVAIDNIKVLDGSCRDKLLVCPDEMASCSDNYTCIVKYKLCDSETDCFDGSDEDRHYCNIACSFETNEVCGYKNASSTDRWMQMNSATSDFLESSKFGFFMIAYPSEDFPMKMQSPKVTMQENKCLRFDYYSTGKLIVTLDASSTIKWLDNDRHKYWREGQFDVPPGDAIVYIMAEWNGLDSLVAIDNIKVLDGSCRDKLLECPDEMASCSDNYTCIVKYKLCDSETDCFDGSDEDRHYCNIACSFETNEVCGYKNASSTDRWMQMNSATSDFFDSSKFGFFMIAYPSEDFPMKMQSPKVTMQENKCLRFDYYSTGKLTVTLDSSSTIKWLDNDRHKYWREGQFDVPLGDAIVYITAEWNGLDSLVAIDNIKVLDGSCRDKLLECPDEMASCSDNYKCIVKYKLCDSETDCFDGSDEDRHYCNYSIQCDFENKSCGYYNVSNSKVCWKERTGSQFTRPQFDKTYGTHQGHFMVVSDNSDPKDYLVDSERILMLTGYNKASLISSEEEIQSESCVEFYYYLNGSEVRPSPLSAQLSVYVISGNRKILAWYDNVNRTINGWLKGWVLVPQGHVRIIFEGKTTTTLAVWPGVVALDEISVKPGPCSEPPDCGFNAFKCATSRVCIPVYLQCDGENDCVDGSDEKGCTSKPDYEVILVNGDGSYGTLAIFYHGQWTPVCYAYEDTLASLACKKLGYKGSYKNDSANSWHKPVSQKMQITCQAEYTDLSQCSLTTSFCDYYQSVLCSNTECFSGERICYNSRKCIPEQYYCDGITDCPFADDEKNCENCTSSEFVCTNHECIPITQRCDGVPQCKDASDEYRCVIVDDNAAGVYVYHSTSKYFPVCSTNMGASLAKRLCNLSGQGTVTSFLPVERTDVGLTFIPDSSVSNILIPGYSLSIESCRPVELKCELIECGTSSLTGRVISPKILFGREATLGQFPWQIALYYNGKFTCGGSIINPNWVLTAAHCVVDPLYQYSVKLGTVELNSTFQGLAKEVSRIHVHQSYDDTYLLNDIALLYFTTPIVMNDYVRPVCLSSKIFYQELLNQGPNAECYISGWGDTEQRIFYDESISQLRMTRVQLITYEECKQIYTSDIQNTLVCVDNSNFGIPACFGDSGGPLVCKNKHGRFQLLGTTSFGSYGTCTVEKPAAYQLVHHHLDWIRSVTGLNFTDSEI